MKQDIIQQHREMVLRLAKPGEKILASLTPWDCNLIHMAACLPGEASELYDAILNDINAGRTGDNEDLLEELGDYAFYLVACRAIISCDWRGDVYASSSPSANCIELMRLGGHLWDVVKRITVYRKPFYLPDQKYGGRELNAVMVELLDQMERRFNAIATFYNFTLEEVLQANWTKLADADKGRYGAAYSDEKAQERRDKSTI